MTDSSSKVRSAIDDLERAATNGKTKKSVLESIDKLSSSVILLNSSSPSSHVIDKLVDMFRHPLVPVYSAFIDPALKFSAAVLDMLFNHLILSCIKRGEDGEREKEGQLSWERVANALLSGVMDFLDAKDEESTKEAIASCFYPIICEFLFENDHISALVTSALPCAALLLLSNTATGSPVNKNKLRDHKLLGGPALGRSISSAYDFAVLETLLNFFAQIMPTETSKSKRVKFIKDVFLHPSLERNTCGQRIVELVELASPQTWDETCVEIVDILSSSNVNYPQPFDVPEVTICGHKYSQPAASDRLYVEKTGFFINILQEDGMYDSLRIPFEDIDDIHVDKGEVTIYLRHAPVTPKGASKNMTFNIPLSEGARFSKTLQSRGVDKQLGGSRAKPKVSITSSALLAFDDEEEIESFPKEEGEKAVKQTAEKKLVDTTKMISKSSVEVHTFNMRHDGSVLSIEGDVFSAHEDNVGPGVEHFAVDEPARATKLKKTPQPKVGKKTKHSVKVDTSKSSSTSHSIKKGAKPKEQVQKSPMPQISTDIAKDLDKDDDDATPRPRPRRAAAAAADIKLARTFNSSQGVNDIVETQEGKENEADYQPSQPLDSISPKLPKSVIDVDSLSDLTDGDITPKARRTGPVKSHAIQSAAVNSKVARMKAKGGQTVPAKPTKRKVADSSEVSTRPEKKVHILISDNDSEPPRNAVEKKQTPKSKSKSKSKKEPRLAVRDEKLNIFQDQPATMNILEPISVTENESNKDVPTQSKRKPVSKSTKKENVKDKDKGTHNPTSAVSASRVPLRTIAEDTIKLNNAPEFDNRAPTDYQSVSKASAAKTVMMVASKDIDSNMLIDVGDDNAQALVPADESRSEESISPIFTAKSDQPIGEGKDVRDAQRSGLGTKSYTETLNENEKCVADVDDSEIDDDELQELLQSLQERRAEVKRRARTILTTKTDQTTMTSPIQAKPIGVPSVAPLQRVKKVAVDLDRKVTSPDHADKENHFNDYATDTVKEIAFATSNKGRKPNVRPAREKEPDLGDIINVLNEINDAVVDKLTRKSRAVRNDVRIARDNMLKEAVNDLKHMQDERIHHYNNLFTLENRYANITRKMDAELRAAIDANGIVCKQVHQTIASHDKNASSRAMPESLFKASLPNIFSKYI